MQKVLTGFFWHISFPDILTQQIQGGMEKKFNSILI